MRMNLTVCFWNLYAESVWNVKEERGAPKIKLQQMPRNGFK